jgi:MSHA biogenesis protein MshJ
MKGAWRRLAERVDAMTLRERVLVFCAVMAAVAGPVYGLLIDPELSRSKALARDLSQRNAEMRGLEKQILLLAGARKQDPDKEKRDRLARLREDLARMNDRIAAEERKFTPADRMRSVVHEILARNRKVALVSLKTLPMSATSGSATIQGATASKPPASGGDRTVYRHGIEVTVTGSYLDVLAYLGDLEKLPSHLYWRSVELEAQYPAVVVKFSVYTLSLDPGWMNV